MDRLSEKELEYVTEVLESGFSSSKSAGMVSKFESKFAEVYESKFAISFVNGTATMHAVLEALGVGVGDEVIVPPLTMSATTFSVLQANGTPVFADVDIDTFQISVDSVVEKITKKTKAILTVGLYGSACDLERLSQICSERNVYLIEDNAEVFGARFKGKLIGKFGIASSFSLQSSKHLTSGEGGVVITDDENLADKIRQIQSLGYAGVSAKTGKILKKDIQNPDYSRHVSMGWNYRMPELCAAVGLAQLERSEELVSARRYSAALFNEVAGKYPEIVKPQAVVKEMDHSYWTWAAMLIAETISWEQFRDTFMRFGGHGIYAAWKLTYLEPFFKNSNFLGRENFISHENLVQYRAGLCPNAERIQPRILQFKTNYWDKNQAHEQAKVLDKTLKYLSS